MPYSSVSELPEAVRKRYNPRCQAVFMRAFNDATGDEASRFKVAHTAAGNCKSSGKASDLKAEPLSTSQLDRWLAGKMPRRILVLPFGGPVDPRTFGLDPAKAVLGVDVDGEFFDERTDREGPYPALRRSRERLVDFHHAAFMGRDGEAAERALKGAIMGRVVLDEEPETVDLDGESFAGLWGDFWANAGEKRRQLIAWLEKNGHALYGSTQPVQAGVRKAGDPGALDPLRTGHIEVWPIQYHTISTSPQNTYAVVPPLKAVLDASDATEVTVEALRALAVDLENLDDLRLTSAAQRGDDGAKAGRVGTAIDDLERAVAHLRAVVPSQTGER